MVFCNMWNSLFFAWFLQHVEQLVCLHDTWNSLHGFACLHVMWFNPVELPLPLFFPVRLHVSGVGPGELRWEAGRHLTKCAAGTVPSGHLTKCAEQARCRAGT